MESQLTTLAVTHLLQHTLRSFCIHQNSQWVYAVFWRILPRNYPPPKWNIHGGAYERSRGNRRNWILVWEDGFCNFAASTAAIAAESPEECQSHTVYDEYRHYQGGGMQPELFFKMSHEIYNYGEGLIGKVAADYSHKWIYEEATNQEINFLSAWQNSIESHPRTWEAQFQSGIKTIALIAVREGVIQLGAFHKVIEDLSYVLLLRKKLSYIESIPGVLLPHPSSSSAYGGAPPPPPPPPPEAWLYGNVVAPPPQYTEFYENYNQFPMKINPSMSSLEALLSKLPSVVPEATTSPPTSAYCEGGAQPEYVSPASKINGMDKVSKEEIEDKDNVGETSSTISTYQNKLFGYHYHGTFH